MKPKNRVKALAVSLTFSVLLVLSFLQTAFAPPLPIGDPTYPQANPFDSNPTTGVFDQVGIPTGVIENAFDGDMDNGINFQYGAGDGYVEVSAFKKPSDNGLADFNINFIDIKIHYKSSGVAASDDRYRIVAYVDPSTLPLVLQDWVTGDEAAYPPGISTDAGTRAFSNVPEPNDGVWTWTDLANLRVRVETDQIDTDDMQRVYLNEVWVTAYSTSYPEPSTMSVQPLVVAGISSGGLFYVDIYVSNVTNFWGYQFVLWFDAAILTPLEYFSYSPFVSTLPSEIGPDYVAVSYKTYDGDPIGFTGNTPITRIYFLVIADGTSPLVFTKAEGADIYGNSVILTPRNGWFASGTIHDVAVTGITLNVTVAQIGQPIGITTSLVNQGTEHETFDVAVFYDSSLIGTKTVTDLLPGANTILNFTWDTSTVAVGTYQVRVEASPVAGETDIEDNAAVHGPVTILAPSMYTRQYLPNQWITDGTAMGWHADDYSWQYTLPFDFPFYGTYYRTIYVSSNGLIAFNSPDASCYNTISELSARFALAAAWDDLRTDGAAGNDIYIWQPDPRHVIIRWQTVSYYDNSIAVNFEAVLASDGVIQLNYGYNNGPISATVGISNGIGEMLAEDITTSNYINSILFTPYRPDHELEVYLEAPSMIPLGQSSTLKATLSNIGTNNETNVELQLFIDNIIVESAVIPELDTESSYTITHEWTPTSEGSYNVTAYAPPLPTETTTSNNIVARTVNVITVEHTFRDDFSTATLDPHWQIWKYSIPAPSPPEAYYQQETRYSLTDYPGYLNYYLGSYTVWGVNEPVYGGPSSPYWYYPSMHLQRMFDGTQWIMETRVTYSAPYANAPISVTYVFFGDPQSQGWNNAIVILGAAWDGYHQVYMVENGIWTQMANLPMNWYFDTFHYRIIRSGYQFTFQWSRDGISYDTAFTETMGSQIDGLPQGVGITGQAFWSDMASYSQYDYVYLSPPPEHDLVVSLEAPNSIVLDEPTTLNATIANQGLNDEMNVRLWLIIDGSQVDSIVIPELLAGDSYRLSYQWTPTAEGNYNITAYVDPVPNEADTTNNQATRFVGVVQPLIRPVEGQWANYTISSQYGQMKLNATYSHYLSPTRIYVDMWAKDQYGNTQIGWATINILNRLVEDGWWSGYWYPLWIENDVTIGSTVGILWTYGNVTNSRFIEVGDFLVDCWGAQFQYYDSSYTFWFDKAYGLVVATDVISYYNYTEMWRLTATNVPLNYLPQIRIQTDPQIGPVGTEVIITGTHATPNGSVEIYWDNSLVGTRTADENGNFAFIFDVPSSTMGSHSITILDLTTNVTDTSVFNVLPSISIAPFTGPIGTRVEVTGSGFRANETLIITFDDMQIGTVFTDSVGSFTATFDVPLSQSGLHLVKAWYGKNHAYTTFTVTDVSPLDVNVEVGAVYFKGETVEFYVQIAFKGKPVDITSMTNKLYMANGTIQTLAYQRIAIGLYKIRYTISGKSSMIGTYTLVVEASLLDNTVNAYGTSITTFIVKPTWERETTRMAALSVTSIGLISAMVILWRKEKKQLL